MHGFSERLNECVRFMPVWLLAAVVLHVIWKWIRALTPPRSRVSHKDVPGLHYHSTGTHLPKSRRKCRSKYISSRKKG